MIPIPPDFSFRLAAIRRHLNGLTEAVEALERELYQSSPQPQPEGDQAAARARRIADAFGPLETKAIGDR